METLLLFLQIITGLGIYNVWFLRAGRHTVYRGRGAGSLKKEFQAYGLPVWFMYIIGTIKVSAATALLVGIWYPTLVLPGALVLAIMMLGAISMHIKVRDSLKRTLPAILMLTMSLIIVLFS